MRRTALAAAFALATCIQAMAAQQAPDPATLGDQEKLGQRLFYQSCGVCHTKPQITAPQFGPVLSMNSAGGSAEAMRAIIENGTARMPGFKLQFSPDQVSAIVAYLKKLPAPTP
jgi:mono/diheme cytochrome c family protein